MSGREAVRSADKSGQSVDGTCGICGLRCGRDSVLMRQHSCAKVVERIREAAKEAALLLMSFTPDSAVATDYPLLWDVMKKCGTNVRIALGE